jgi:hypothetical protein
MGIKFLCPNGHKLHVKSFLSGKKAICPKCGARVTVPEADANTVIDLDLGSPAGGSSADILAAAESSIVTNAGRAPATASSAAPAGASTKTAGARVAAAEMTAPAASSAATSDSPKPPGGNPIDEAPGAVWYVRPATGGQFGPASGEIMRAWITEGRVGASSLVWRAGWADWRSAAATFPELGSLLASPAAVAPAKAVVPNAAASPVINANGALARGETDVPLGQAVETVPVGGPGGPVAPRPVALGPAGVPGVRKRKRKNDVSLMASAILIVISIILVIGVILVFRAQSEPDASETQEKPPAKEVLPI